MNGIEGAFLRTPSTSASKAGSTGSTMAEWKACDTCSLRATVPRAVSSRSTAAMASGVPDSTHSLSSLTAARLQSDESHGCNSASDMATAIISPRGRLCIRRPRAAMRVSASSSPNTPAMHAATYSPTLCPSMTAGCTPQCIHSRAIAYSTTKSAGCVMAVCESFSVAAT